MEGKQEFNPVPEGIMVKGGVDVAAGKPTTQLEGPPTMAAFQPLSVVMPTQGSTGDAEVNKRRGRPRKYGPGAVPAAAALSPMPISASIPLSGDFSGWKQHTAATTTAAATTAAASATAAARDKPFPTIKKVHRLQSETESNGDRLAFLVGGNFTPHMITVNAGEDVAMKILSFSLLESQAICVLSATGSISLVTLRHPNSSGGTLTYEGCFEILSLSGSFMPIYNGILKSRSGGLSVSLAGPDGRVLGGGLAGLLIAASPVQVVLGSFLPGQQLEQKPKKQRTEPSLNREATGGGQKLNLASYQMQDSKDVETDNNLSSSSPEGESDEDSPSRYQMSG